MVAKELDLSVITPDYDLCVLYNIKQPGVVAIRAWKLFVTAKMAASALESVHINFLGSRPDIVWFMESPISITHLMLKGFRLKRLQAFHRLWKLVKCQTVMNWWKRLNDTCCCIFLVKTITKEPLLGLLRTFYSLFKKRASVERSNTVWIHNRDNTTKFAPRSYCRQTRSSTTTTSSSFPTLAHSEVPLIYHPRLSRTLFTRPFPISRCSRLPRRGNGVLLRPRLNCRSLPGWIPVNECL